ncbi:MAG: DUF3833 domain-containing protein [Caulobacterales bacterium]|jgi:hypothetical protein
MVGRGALVALAGMMAASGCATTQAPLANVSEPALRLESYFEGETQAWGVFRDRFGNLRRQFQVTIDGTWDGQTLTLDEDFVYSDGALERRVWTIRPTGPNTYEGTAGDVRGVALGHVEGNTLRWAYDLDLQVNGRTWTVDFDDRMYLQPDGVMINHATVRKFGITVGEVLLVFQRAPAAATPAAPAAAE